MKRLAKNLGFWLAGPPKSLRFPLLGSVVFAAMIALASCGGGSSGGGGAAAVTLKGQVTDVVIPNAAVYLTSGAPYGMTGANLLSKTTADSNGYYSFTVTPPSSSVQCFITAVGTPSGTSGNVQLSSFIGTSTNFSGTMNSNNIPNLTVTQVTTSSLAAYAQNNNGSYTNITPITYQTTVSQLENQIVVLAAIVQDLVDNAGTCAISNGSGTTDLTNIQSLLGSGTISSNTTILTNALSNLSNCSSSTIQTNESQIQGNPTLITQINGSGASTQSSGLPSTLSAGTYTGVIRSIDTYCSNSNVCGNSNGGNSFEAQMTLSSGGGMTFNANLNNNNGGTGSGTLTGTNFTMNITPGNNSTYTVTSATASGTITLSTTSGTSGQFSMGGAYQANYANGTTENATFTGQFYPGTTLPSNVPVPTVNTSSNSQGITCSSGTPYFLGGPNTPAEYNPLYALGVPVCITGTTTGFTMTLAPGATITCAGASSTSSLPCPSNLPTMFSSPVNFIKNTENSGVYTSMTINDTYSGIAYNFGLNYIVGTQDMEITYCVSSGTPPTGEFACPTSFDPQSMNVNSTSSNTGWNTSNVFVNGGIIMN